MHIGHTIYLGGTSIDYLITKYVPKDLNYTVVINSIIIADELKGLENIYITCGKVRGRGSMNDPLTIEIIKKSILQQPQFKINISQLIT